MVGYGVNRYRIRAIQVYGYTSVDAIDIIGSMAGGNSNSATPISRTSRNRSRSAGYADIGYLTGSQGGVPVSGQGNVASKLRVCN